MPSKNCGVSENGNWTKSDKRPSASMGISETNGVGDIQDWVASYTSLSLQVEDNGLANGDCILPVVVVVVLHHVAALTQAMVSTKDSKHTLLIEQQEIQI